MSGVPSSDAIRLRRCHMVGSNAQLDTAVSLQSKLDELLGEGFERDDLFALVIPLLMQGKVRLDIGAESERLELEDQDLRQTRPNAIRIFEEYLATRAAGLAHAH